MSISLTAAAQPAPLIGRDAQLAQLDGLYDRVLAEGGRVALIGGDAGAGKTSLVQRFVRSVADRRPAPLLVVGQCVPFGGAGLPYAPVVGVLRALQARHGDERLLEWAGGGRRALAGLLPDLVEAERAEAPLQLQLFEAVARIWQRAAELEPLIVVLEDLHWADESSRNLLRFLVRYLDDARVLVIGTYRTDEMGRRHPLRPVLAELARLPRVDRMQVGQLDRAQVAELVARLLGRRADAALVNRIHRRSDGLPFYVEELTQSAMRAGQGIPESLREALGVRFEALGSSAQDTLRLASVAGNRVSDELLAEVAGAAPELEADLREAVDAGVLVVDGNGYAFRHSLLRETVYDDLLPGQRARLHARFAAALERRPDLAGTSAAHSIALHWSAAGDTECAFSASVTAARSSGVAFSEALRMFETVLDLWDQVADPVTVAGRLDVLLDDAAKAAADAGEDERAVELYGRALELGPADDVPRRIKRLISRSRLQAALLRPGAAVDVAAAVDLLPQVDDPRFRARTLDRLAGFTMITGGNALDLAREAIAAARAIGDEPLESNSRNTLGTALVASGREEEGLAELVRSGELAGSDQRAVLRFHLNYSDSLHLTGHYREAATEALAGVEVARRMGLERALGTLLIGNAAEPLIALGEWDRAGEMLESALELDPPASQQAHLRLLLAWLTLWRGDPERSEKLLGRYRSLLSVDQPMPQYAAQAIRIDGEHAIATGDATRAWSNLRWFVQHDQLYDANRELPVLAMGAAAAVLLDRDQPEGRTKHIRTRLAASPSGEVRRQWQPVIEAELADSVAGWRAAVAELAALPVTPAHLRPYAQLRLAQLLHPVTDRTELRALLADTADRARVLGAGLILERLAPLAQQAGMSVTAPADRPAPLAALTSRELEVLRLVAAGRSNGEIGTELFISTKTASVHVSNILAKLGVGGRGEAAAIAHRGGLMASAEPHR